MVNTWTMKMKLLLFFIILCIICSVFCRSVLKKDTLYFNGGDEEERQENDEPERQEVDGGGDDLDEAGDGDGNGLATATNSPVVISHLTVIKSAEDIRPPDHIEGMMMERDGELNKEFQREVFLGADKEVIQNEANESKQRRLLKDVIQRIDENQNGMITHRELANWVKIKMVEHFNQSITHNGARFKLSDPDRDGLLTWVEYTIEFALYRNYDEDAVKQAVARGDKYKMSLDDEYALIVDQIRWQQADDDGDNKLNEREFLSFHHPEHCERMLKLMTQEIVEDLDRDGDGSLSLTEFVFYSHLPVSDEETFQNEDYATDSLIGERKQEFQELIDQDSDGLASFQELLQFNHPNNPHVPEHEAWRLVLSADENGDNELSFKEILDSDFLFIGSKVMNYERILHDEF